MSESLGQSASVWMNVSMPNTAPLREDATTDVLIVGAGIAGLSAAYHLAREGRHVMVVDDSAIGSGETGRTTAHLSNVIDDRIFALARLHGDDVARLAVESHMAAVTRIEQIVTLEGINCEFERLDGYLIEGTAGDATVLECEYDAAREAGLVDTQWMTRAPLSSFETGRCLRFPNQAAFHPLKYLIALADRIVELGGRIHTGTRVTEMAEAGPPMQLHTKDGPRITANAVVVATNAPVIGDFHLANKQVAMRSYVVTAVVPSGSVTRALYWDTLDPYHYVRVATRSAEEGDYLIVGGEDHRTGQEANPAARFHQLEEWTRARFPMVTSFVHHWSGQVLEPLDGLAFIGRSSEHRDVYCVSGDSGQGMTHGTIAGILLTDLIQGRQNPWERLYAPDREVKGASGKLLREAANRAAQLKELLTPGDVDSEADIVPGTGAILRRGLEKIAAYRDPGGTLHECDATCTHKGCVVRWNAVEHTWDCPCHGSRFNPVGRVLNGPAIDDLRILASPLRSTRAS